MNKIRLLVAMIGYTCVSPSSSHAQLILTGCTAYPQGSPQPSYLVDINVNTGAASNPRSIGISVMSGVATQPSTGVLFGLSSRVSNPVSSLVTIDPVTGTPTIIGPTGLPFLTEGDLAFNPINGLLYGINDAGSDLLHRNLFQINPNTGSATVIGSLGSTGDYSTLAFTASGMLYTIDDLPNNNSAANAVLSIIDPNTATIVNSITTNLHMGTAMGMTVDPITGTVYVADGGVSAGANNSLYTLDLATGFFSLVGSTGYPGGIEGLAFVSVPEPSALVFSGFGMAIVVAYHTSRVFGKHAKARLFTHVN